MPDNLEFSRYKKATQREYVIRALDYVLRNLTERHPTAEITQRVLNVLGARKDAGVSVARILAEIAPHVPEAERGETFKAYGRTMQRWNWWPKGQIPSGDATRQAKRQSEAGLLTWREFDALTDAAKDAIPWMECNLMPRDTVPEIQSHLAEMQRRTGRPLSTDEDDTEEVWSA